MVDESDNLLVGIYTTIAYGPDPDSSKTKSAKVGAPIYTNHLVSVDLGTGKVVSDKVVDLGDGIFMSCYYYNQAEKSYVLYRADEYLITINPLTAKIVRDVPVGRTLFNMYYDQESGNVITLRYCYDDQRDYVEASPSRSRFGGARPGEPLPDETSFVG